MNRIIEQPAAEYHADLSAWSRSMLSTFRESKREAFLRYIEKSAPEEEPKPCMKLGSLAHAMLMEPANLSKQFCIIPQDILAKNGAISTKEAKQFVEDNAKNGISSIKQHEWDNSKRVVDSVLKVCGKWLEKATKVEHSIYWEDEITGLQLKARPDWFVVTDGATLIFDLKTTTRIIPHTFARVIETHEYWLQECHYRQGVTEAQGWVSQMFFVGIEQQWPYRCALFQLSDDAKRKAFECWRFTVNELANSIEKNDWQDSWESDITTVDLKDYVFKGRD